MRALSELFDATTLVVPCAEPQSQVGEIPLEGNNLSIARLSLPAGKGLARKIGLPFWLLRSLPIIVREIVQADAVHAPIPGDIGTIGMLLAFVLRKPLFVRHCGNWLKPVTHAEYFWKWFMVKFAGGKQVMLATGGADEPPSKTNSNVRWIFSTSLGEKELQSPSRELPTDGRAKLIIVCRQDELKGTGTVIQSLPLILSALPRATLDVVGDGASLSGFRKLAETLRLSDRVTFHGKVNHEAVVELLKQADLFCYPTRASEGFPKVVLEALAGGLPVITTRVSVLPELIGAGGGVLLDEPTAEALARSIVSTLSDAEAYRQMSVRAIETATQFSLERWRDTIGNHLENQWGQFRQKQKSPTLIEPKDLKVCFLAGTLGRGGAERQLIYMLKSLKNLGVNVRLLCLTQGEALEEEIRSIGIPITFVGSSPAKLIRLYQIIKELRRNRPQIVQSAHFYTNLYAAVAGRVLGIKSIGAIRNDLFSEIKANGVLGKAQLNQPDHLIANTALAQSRARAKGVTNVHVLPNVTAVNGLRAQAGDANEAVFQILFAGRLTEQKRADCFLRSLRQLADTRPDLEFKGIVAGDGPLRARLEGLADQLSLRPRYCEFLGEVGDLKSLYLKSDVLLLTSEWEGSPNVVLEAMSAGLPVVATRVGGVPELVQDGENGFLTQSEDVDSIVRSLIRLSENAALRNSMGMAGREKVLQRHTAERLGERLLKMYRTLVSDRGEDPAPAAMFNTNGRQMRNSSTSGEIEVV